MINIPPKVSSPYSPSFPSPSFNEILVRVLSGATRLHNSVSAPQGHTVTAHQHLELAAQPDSPPSDLLSERLRNDHADPARELESTEPRDANVNKELQARR